MKALIMLAAPIALLSAGCANQQEFAQESADANVETATAAEKPAVATDEYRQTPQIDSIQPSKYSPPANADPHIALRDRIAEIGRPNILIVDAQVTGTSVSRRILPEELHWGPYPHLVTSMKLEISKTYCGDEKTDAISASFVGGRLFDGSVEVTELMPQTLSVGQSHVFVLRQVENEYFLELGQLDMLGRNDKGQLTNPSAQPIEVSALEEICR